MTDATATAAGKGGAHLASVSTADLEQALADARARDLADEPKRAVRAAEAAVETAELHLKQAKDALAQAKKENS